MIDNNPKVVFLFKRGRIDLIKKINNGLSPDDKLYGYNHINSVNLSLDFIEDEHVRNFNKILFNPLEYAISHIVGIGFGLSTVLNNFNIIKKADLIVSTVDTYGLPIALLKTLRIINKPVIYISQGLSDRIECLKQNPFYYVCFSNLYRQFLKTVDKILVFGKGARNHTMDIFQLDHNKVFYIPYGIDQNYWVPDQKENLGKYILSVGNDRARDYDLLSSIEWNIPLVIVSKLPIRTKNQQIKVLNGISDASLRQLYQNSQFVVTPLKNVFQPSGQSATFQAMACSKPVILSKTFGLWDPDQMLHMHNCCLVNPGDKLDLSQNISMLENCQTELNRIGKNGNSTVLTHYTSQNLGQALQAHILEFF